MTVRDTGYHRYWIWEHSSTIKDLYRRRSRREESEMVASAQAVKLLAPFIEPGDAVLDAGCGSGYLYHSFAARKCPVEYYGIDAAPSLIGIAHEELPAFGLPRERLRALRIEDLDGEVDHALCITVLSNIDNYHRPLERLLKMARKTVVLRESMAKEGQYLYVQDKYLDPGIDLRVHVNTYPERDLLQFIESYGFATTVHTDERTGGAPEMIIDYPHHWKFVVARRLSLT